MAYYSYPYMNTSTNYNSMPYVQGTSEPCYSTFNQVGQGYQRPYLTPAIPSPPSLSDPSMSCGIDGCVATLPVERDRASLAFHLLFEHGYLLGDVQTVCRWQAGGGKSSSSTSNFKLKSTSNAHSLVGLQPNGIVQPCQWHGKGAKLLDHIVNSHLNFVDLCSKCGSGPFSRKSSLDRHEVGCQGRVPARCRDCLREFPSIVALGGHAELGLCWPTS
jgi:hypothetical protein